MPLVSVVIPAYNAAQWIPETIGSVLQQTYRDLEIIIVDDGSTDHTPEVADDILRKGPFTYRLVHQKNKGPSAARNRGWRVSSGQWIQFLDADDLLHPQKIERQVDRRFSKGADVIYSDWQRLCWYCGIWKKEEYVYSPLIGPQPLLDLLRGENFMAMGSQLFASSLLARIGGFNESRRLIEDVEFQIKIAIKDGVFTKIASDEPLFWYRDRPQSLSKSDGAEFVEGCIRNAKMVELHLRQTRCYSPEIVAAIVAQYHQGSRFYAEYDWNRFERVLADIEALQPGFLPAGPASLRALSRLFGYRRAERVSVLYRRLKSLVKPVRRA